MRLINSGINGLDEVLGGGIPENSVITVGGPTGCGKTIFSMQFVLAGRQPGLFIAMEDSREDLINEFATLGWDLEQEEKKGNLIILDYPVHEVDQLLSRRGGVHEIIASNGVKRVVVDTILPVALHYKDEEERKRGFLEFIDNLRSWNATTMLVASSSSFSPIPYTDYRIEQFTHGWINLYYEYDNKTDSRIRRLEVLKMKGANHSTKRYSFVIDNRGITLLNTEASISKVRDIVRKIAKTSAKKQNKEPKKRKLRFSSQEELDVE